VQSRFVESVCKGDASTSRLASNYKDSTKCGSTIRCPAASFYGSVRLQRDHRSFLARKTVCGRVSRCDNLLSVI